MLHVLINILDSTTDCPEPYNKLQNIFNLISDIINLIKIAAPLILIILGMLDFAKGVTAGKEDDIKKAQNLFVKRVIMGVAVFFVITIVSIIMNIISDNIPNEEDGSVPNENPLLWTKCLNI